MKIRCPICNQIQEFNFMLLFNERCNSCNEKFSLHYSKPIKLIRSLMQIFIILIAMYISTTYFQKLLLIPLIIFCFMITEILCLFSLRE